MTFTVFEERRGDRFEKEFGSLDEANAFASGMWQHLTVSEQRSQHIFVGIAKEFDGGGMDIDIPVGAFDSEKLGAKK